MVTELTKLTTEQIIELLEKTGYGAVNEIWDVAFNSITNNNAIKYSIKFEDCEGNEDTGFVFVYINSQGNLVCEF